MSVIPPCFSVNFSLNLEICEKISTEWLNTLEKLPDNTILFLSSSDMTIYNELYSKTHLKLVPTYSVLRETSNLSKNLELYQIDAAGNAITPYLCPNHPELESLISADFETLSESPQITGIQLENLEMPFQLSHFGCFCSHCSTLADKNGIDLSKISRVVMKKANNGLSATWIRKNFPKWLKFRAETIYNLAGKLMIMLRKLNPNIFLGLNVDFTKAPELLGQNYFFLALFLDLLNFRVNSNGKFEEKKILKQLRSVTKTFLGEIKLFLQMKVPIEYNLTNVRKFITKAKGSSFDGLVLQISNLEELKQFM